ncbi:hypothetical protein AWJ20_2796 [Sugiyamaella lignohabitans]|uniref:Uncharacterized protein n=1 Tax=Sugiyamaella lignohabitans TaxID=796027 RepID=A0A167FDT2_9ASCO|nr:uncharacterized protein AWJ20_2796 [Sugiyamaella lignohabitans]ANB15172.1 hypothetical protein AWJ20_2796 [Sugiyamaella lignohabitans]
MGLLTSDLPPAKCFLAIAENTGTFPLKLIESHNGSKQVDLITTSTTFNSSIKSLTAGLGSLHTYTIKCELRTFLSNDFLDNWIRKSGINIILISETRLDHEDVYSIIDGQLVLSFTKDTYYKAGLLGQKSKSSKSRFIVKYDLRDPKLYESKSFERLRWASENTLTDQLPFAFTIHTSLTPAPDFSNARYTEIKPIVRTIPKAAIPKFRIPEKDGNVSSEVYKEEVQEWASSCYEWSSLVTLESPQVHVHSNVDSYLSTYSLLDPEDTPDDITLVTWKNGPIPRSYVLALFENLKETPSNSWYMVNVMGIEDIPIAWGSKEHNFLTSGENNYSVTKLMDNKILSLKIVNGKDL